VKRSLLALGLVMLLAVGCAPAGTAPGDTGQAEQAPLVRAAASAVATQVARLAADESLVASVEGLLPGFPVPEAADAAEFPAIMPGQRDGRRVVVLDPGHGGPEGGSGGGGLVEKTLNLRIALYLEEMLLASGHEVVMTRRDDGPVHPAFTNAADRALVRVDLQERVDIANAARADLFISIHNNGSTSATERGTEVWYSPLRPFGDRNEFLARSVLQGMLSRLEQAGHPVANRGIKSDEFFIVRNGVAFNLYVLGPGGPPRPHVPTLMPGILGESLFQTNPTDAAALRRPEILQAIAHGYYDGIRAYFEAYPDY
jgi:N-acetylmuramoyl-L-alanine amidase